jgi:hypothetical protein
MNPLVTWNAAKPSIHNTKNTTASAQRRLIVLSSFLGDADVSAPGCNLCTTRTIWPATAATRHPRCSLLIERDAAGSHRALRRPVVHFTDDSPLEAIANFAGV